MMKRYRIPASEILPAVVMMSGGDMSTTELVTRRGARCTLPAAPSRGCYPTAAGLVLLYLVIKYLKHANPAETSIYFPLRRFSNETTIRPHDLDQADNLAGYVDRALQALTLGRYSWQENEPEGEEVNGLQLLESGEENNGEISARLTDEFAEYIRRRKTVLIPAGLLAVPVPDALALELGYMIQSAYIPLSALALGIDTYGKISPFDMMKLETYTQSRETAIKQIEQDQGRTFTKEQGIAVYLNLLEDMAHAYTGE